MPIILLLYDWNKKSVPPRGYTRRSRHEAARVSLKRRLSRDTVISARWREAMRFASSAKDELGLDTALLARLKSLHVEGGKRKLKETFRQPENQSSRTVGSEARLSRFFV